MDVHDNDEILGIILVICVGGFLSILFIVEKKIEQILRVVRKKAERKQEKNVDGRRTVVNCNRFRNYMKKY